MSMDAADAGFGLMFGITLLIQMGWLVFILVVTFWIRDYLIRIEYRAIEKHKHDLKQ